MNMKPARHVLFCLCCALCGEGAQAISLGITQSADFSGSIGASSVIGGQAIDGGASLFANLGDGDLLLDIYRPRTLAEFVLDALAMEQNINHMGAFCGNLPLLEIGVGCDFLSESGERKIFGIFSDP